MAAASLGMGAMHRGEYRFAFRVPRYGENPDIRKRAGEVNKKGRRKAGPFGALRLAEGIDRVDDQYLATTGPPQLKR